MIVGNGQTTVTHDHASIGELPAIVCDDNDLKEDLGSVNPLLDSGYKLTMESEFRTLFNEETQQTIHVRRDLAQAVLHNPELKLNPGVTELVQANAVMNTIPASIRDQVISLHERMGHANTEAICAAISGDPRLKSEELRGNTDASCASSRNDLGPAFLLHPVTEETFPPATVYLRRYHSSFSPCA